MVSVTYFFFFLFLLQPFKNVKTISSMQGVGKQVCRLEFADPRSKIILETCSRVLGESSMCCSMSRRRGNSLLSMSLIYLT